ncbi:hypothetical protein [Kocuria tytonis]|uniref:hypothetical protein n=1 Tax=Kocuria tytonis TaxID=2054280 RepID=UPI0011C3A65B|nr:hypothetical protein [Kocuria tytonis]
MKLTQTLPAAVIAVLLAGTWAVPAPTTSVGAHEKGTLTTASGTTVSFDAPRRWSTTPSTSRTSTAYTRTEDDQVLTLSVIEGSEDFDTTADRVLRQKSLSGTSAAFDGGRITSRSGFSGKSCVAIKSAEKATGPCAVVH